MYEMNRIYTYENIYLSNKTNNRHKPKIKLNQYRTTIDFFFSILFFKENYHFLSSLTFYKLNIRITLLNHYT